MTYRWADLFEKTKISASLGLAHRPEQRAFAADVAKTIDLRGIGLIQADTGIGKTLGYLAPALSHVSAGGRVIIATWSLQLIRQLLEKDLPVAINAYQSATGIKPEKICG